MLTRLAAQGLTDALTALALGACMFAVLRRDGRASLSIRLAFAMGGLCVFLLARSAGDIFREPRLNLLAEMLACPLPVIGLTLAEGVLRRHAPRALKILIALGAAGLLIALAALGETPLVSTWALGGYMFASLSALTLLLLTRDRASLSRQENTSIDALMLAGAALAPLSLTDFVRVAPVGMGGIGAALLALQATRDFSAAGGTVRVLTVLAVLIACAGAFAAALAWALGMTDPTQVARLEVVSLAFVIALVAILAALSRRGGVNEERALRQALASANVSDLPTFLEHVVAQPLLSGLTIAEGAALAEYDAAALGDTLALRPIWTRAALRAEPPAAIGGEQLADLMARREASHAALISRAPLRVALLTLPQIGPADSAEIDLALFRKLAAIAAGERT